jgi:hypothetical protein
MFAIMVQQTMHNYNPSFSMKLLEVGTTLKVPQDMSAKNGE